ncbi:MAG: NADPH-flavin oxidoreductase [Acidimicrobiaceae bacterium]|nr:NADPH-flavin oxidoreductase [Acidimicrobiaceae bacterium]
MTFSAAEFKATMSRFATGVTIVTGVDGDEPVGFTCQSFISLSIDPPFIALAPARSSTSWPRIAHAGQFCVNILADTQRELAQKFAVSGGDKFKGMNWTASPATGSPLIAGSVAWVDCKVELVHEAGDHELIVGKVLDLGISAGSPLLFIEAKYVSIKGPEDPAERSRRAP